MSEPLDRPAAARERFRFDFERALARVAAPLFARAVEQAGAHGLVARRVTGLDAAAVPYLGLCLGAEEEVSDGYWIKADVARQRVSHERRVRAGVASRRVESDLASINETLVNTEVAALFMASAGLRVDLLSGHKIGF
ncbi:MAG TPA: hypothetical protein VJA19_06225 [Pseudomonas sp.]|nr:hypothetical protein [Pseudomonas sp.]